MAVTKHAKWWIKTYFFISPLTLVETFLTRSFLKLLKHDFLAFLTLELIKSTLKNPKWRRILHGTGGKSEAANLQSWVIMIMRHYGSLWVFMSHYESLWLWSEGNGWLSLCNRVSQQRWMLTWRRRNLALKRVLTKAQLSTEEGLDEGAT